MHLLLELSGLLFRIICDISWLFWTLVETVITFYVLYKLLFQKKTLIVTFIPRKDDTWFKMESK